MLSVFALVLFGLSVVSANNFSLSVIDNLPSNVEAGEVYIVKVQVENTNSNYTNGVNLSFSGSGFTLLTANDDAILYGGQKDFEFNLTVSSSQDFGSFSRTLTASVYNASDLTDKIEDLSVVLSSNVPEISFCESEGTVEVGDLDIKAFDINNNGEGDDDLWNPLDDITIDVDVKNTNDDDSIYDVMVELKIMRDGDDVTDDFELDDSEFDIGKIKSKDTESASFIISEVPIDLDEGNYEIYVMVYSDGDEENQCISKDGELDDYGDSIYYAEIEVENEFDSGIIVKDYSNSLSVVCSQENVEFVFSLYNVGDDKEEKVLVQLYNSELGINEKIVIDNFKSAKKKESSFFVNMPETLSENYYYLDVITYWNWDDDEDELDTLAYDDNSDDDLDDDYSVKLNVLSCSVPEPIVSAELLSDEVIVGNEAVIKVSVSNPSNKDDDFSVSVNGYESWAELVSVQPSALGLGAGESKEVMITFNLKESGVNAFNVRVSGTDNTVVQDVSLSVSEKESSLFDFGSISGDLTYWIAGVLIVLILFLFILILTVALRRRA